METRLLAFDKIQYKRKVIDEGIILGKRPWKWTLGNKYSPCIAKRINDNYTVSQWTPQKQNFSVYISKHALVLGETYCIVKREYPGDRFETTVKVEELQAHFCKVSIIDEKKIPVKKEIIIKPVILGDQSVFGAVFGGTITETTEAEDNQEDVTHLDDLLNFFEECGQTTTDEDLKETPCEPTRQGVPQGAREVSEETSSTSKDRIMIKDIFVKEKNQIGFGFAVPNQTKSQLSLLQYETKPGEKPPTKQQAHAKKQECKPLPSRRESTPVPIVGFSPQEIAVLDALHKDPQHIDDIVHASGLNVGLVSGLLLMLEMAGKVRQHYGHNFSKY